MNSDNHNNPAIHQRLQSFVGQQDWQGLFSYLSTLTNAHFRTAGYMLGERVLPTLEETDAWKLAIVLVDYNAKAFLVTMLKTIVCLLEKGCLHLHSKGGNDFLVLVGKNRIDTKKALMQLVPVMKNPEDIRWLLFKLQIEEGKEQLSFLLHIPTMPASYVLFHTLRFAEHDRALLVRVAFFLMKRGDSLAFNLASLLKAYYGLEEVKGTFSLRLQPYQLSRLSESYEAFCQAMKI